MSDGDYKPLTREEKLEKWERIYAKAMEIIWRGLGSDKDAVYGACQTIQTASREIGIVTNVMKILGELEPQKSKNVVGYELTDEDSILEELFSNSSADA